MQLKDQLCFKLYVLSRQMTNLYRPLLDQLDITYPQYLVMLVLWQEKQLSVKELGIRLHLDSGTLTPLLKRLEQKAFLTRKRDVKDERSVLIGLTPNGEAMEERAQNIPEQLQKCLKLTESDYTQIKTTLDNMLMNIEQFSDQATHNIEQ